MVSRPLMALFVRVAKLGSGAYGARHARVRPFVMQCVLAVTETVVIKLSRASPIPSPVPSLRPYIHLSLKKREVSQHLHITHTVRLAWWCRATLHLSHH